MTRLPLITLIAILTLPLVCDASPFLVCDPQSGVTHYRLTGPSWVPETVPAQSDGSIKMDVSSATVGTNSLTVKACRNDDVWGELCSDAVPFAFTRPSAAAPPLNIHLSR